MSDYFVDPAGNDANSGLVGFPWQHIAHAANVFSYPAGPHTVTITAGEYRESVDWNGISEDIEVFSSTSSPVVITPATSINPATDWTAKTGGEYLYSGAVTSQWVMFLEDGARALGMTDYASQNPAFGFPVAQSDGLPGPGLQPGEFYVDTTGNKLYYRPSTGTPADHTQDVTNGVKNGYSVTNCTGQLTFNNIHGFGGSSESGINVDNSDDIWFYDCKGYASHLGITAERGCDNIVMQDCEASDCAKRGMGMRGPNPAGDFTYRTITITRPLVRNVGTKKYDDTDAEGIMIIPFMDFTITDPDVDGCGYEGHTAAQKADAQGILNGHAITIDSASGTVKGGSAGNCTGNCLHATVGQYVETYLPNSHPIPVQVFESIVTYEGGRNLAIPGNRAPLAVGGLFGNDLNVTFRDITMVDGHSGGTFTGVLPQAILYIKADGGTVSFKSRNLVIINPDGEFVIGWEVKNGGAITYDADYNHYDEGALSPPYGTWISGFGLVTYSDLDAWKAGVGEGSNSSSGDAKTILGVRSGQIPKSVYPTTLSPLYLSGTAEAVNDAESYPFSSPPTKGGLATRRGKIKSTASGLYAEAFYTAATWVP